MGRFFSDGGFGMFPVLLFGFLCVASGVLFLLRPQRRYVGLVVSLGITTAISALLGFCAGLIGTFRYVQGVPESEQFKVAAAGASDSLHVVMLALILMVIAAIVSSIGTFRATRAPAGRAAVE